MKEKTMQKITAGLLAGTITATGISLTGCIKKNSIKTNPNSYKIRKIDIKYVNDNEPSDKEYYIYNQNNKQIIDGPFKTFEEAIERKNNYINNYTNQEKNKTLNTQSLIGYSALTIIEVLLASSYKKVKHKELTLK